MRPIAESWNPVGIFWVRRLSRFEVEFASYCGARHCIGVGNGLDALQLILRGLGIGEGDEVIVPGNTYIATWLAVSRLALFRFLSNPIPKPSISIRNKSNQPLPSEPGLFFRCIFTDNRRIWTRLMHWPVATG